MNINVEGKTYKIIKKLGSGAFGVTFLGLDNQSGEQLAIKLLYPNEDSKRSYQEELNNKEFLTTHLFNGFNSCHPSILCYRSSDLIPMGSKQYRQLFILLSRYSTSLVNGMPIGVFISSFIKGTDLKNKKLNEHDSKRLLKQMLEVLQILHSKGIYHRDIKPANIMVTTNGIFVLVDFGISCFEIKDGTNINGLRDTCTNTFAGSPAYLSPELLEIYDTRELKYPLTPELFRQGDIYALAITVLEMYYGPFDKISQLPDSEIKQMCMYLMKYRKLPVSLLYSALKEYL